MAQDCSEAVRQVMLSAEVADTFDGATRLLQDVQRFGLSIRNFHVESDDGHRATIRMTLIVAPDADGAQIRSRLSRHGTVLSLAPV